MTAHPLTIRVSRVGLVPARRDPNRSVRQSEIGSATTAVDLLSKSGLCLVIRFGVLQTPIIPWIQKSPEGSGQERWMTHWYPVRNLFAVVFADRMPPARWPREHQPPVTGLSREWCNWLDSVVSRDIIVAC
jgi:hypothetical protein